MRLILLLLLLSLLLFYELCLSVKMASTSSESSPETPIPLSTSSSSSSGASSSTVVLSTDGSISHSTPKRLGSVWKSPVWEYFNVAEDNKFAECNECADMVSRGGRSARNFNTTNLVNHLKSKHQSIYREFLELKNKKDKERQESRNVRVQQGGFTGLRQLSLQSTKLLNKQWDINDTRAKAVHQRLGEMIALDYQPMSIVEDMGFRRFVNILEPKYNLPSRKYITETVIHKIYTGIKEELHKLVHAPGVEYYSFTTDVWSTNVASHSLLSLTGHWVDKNFQKISAVLSVEELQGSHTGNHISEKFNIMLAEWKIEKTRVHLVLHDNACNMDKAMRDSGLKSYGCFAHSLQLVVNDRVLSQKSVSDLLAICRQIVGHFKRSTVAYNKLNEIQRSLGLPEHHLKQDEPTRWNSSLYMLESIVEQKMALAAYGSGGSITVLTSTQLDIATKVINILSPIEEITKKISADSSIISQIIPLVRALTKVLEKQDEDHGVRTMKRKMLESLNHRFADIEDIDFLALATLLDPRYKDKFFTSSSSRQYAKEMLLTEYTYFLEDNELDETDEPPAKRPARDNDDEDPTKLWGCLSEIISQSTSSSTSEEETETKEVNQYISAPLVDFKHGNPLRWWQSNCENLPILAKIARKYLSAPSTSVSSEHLFSGAGELYDDK